MRMKKVKKLAASTKKFQAKHEEQQAEEILNEENARRCKFRRIIIRISSLLMPFVTDARFVCVTASAGEYKCRRY